MNYYLRLSSLLALFVAFCLVCGLPQSPQPFNFNATWPTHTDLILSELKGRDNKPFYLRIMALGASIANGYMASDQNGFRKLIRDRMRSDGWPVNMVGSVRTGNMRDNDHEGHIGLRIDEINAQYVNTVIAMQPNLILMNLGTNDASQNFDVPEAGDRMITLLTQIYAGIPETTIVLSTLLPNGDASTRDRARQISGQYRDLVMPYFLKRNKKITLAEMDNGFITLADIPDGTHPNDFGYKKMAAVFYAAIADAGGKAWITAPSATGPNGVFLPSDSKQGYTCPKAYGKGRGPIQIQAGSGYDDGGYVHASEDMGRVFKLPASAEPQSVFFAQLVNVGGAERGGEFDEFVWIEFPETSAPKYWFWTNWADEKVFDPKQVCKASRIRFGDLNNDGLDDFLCLSDNGDMFASLNRGGNPPSFEYIGLVRTAPAGYTADAVRIADIDGDGRADYCIVVSGGGNIICTRNGGSGDAPIAKYGGFWQDFSEGGADFTEIFPTQNKGNMAGINLVDLNGDFKADWLYMDNGGRIETWINTRGGLRKGMIPGWRNTGTTHPAVSGETEGNKYIKFGRIYGTNRRDYIRIEREGTVKYLHIWKNLGKGATYLKSDGTRYCDMDGDGRDDYVWISPMGELTVFINIGSPPAWGQGGVAINLNLPRKSLHLADWTGTGKCDIIQINKADGKMHLWENTYNGDWKTAFKDRGAVPGNYGCKEGWGVGENDLGIRLADLTGSGRADYLCIERDGRVTGYLNRGNGVLEDVGQIKLPTGYDKANTRFIDTNGDGRADLLWINKYTGDTTVYYNMGEIPSSGSHFQWVIQGPLYVGTDRGTSINFASIGGQHRADMIQIVPTTNIAYVYYNECPDGGNGGDDPGWGNPDLPQIVVPVPPTTTPPAGPPVVKPDVSGIPYVQIRIQRQIVDNIKCDGRPGCSVDSFEEKRYWVESYGTLSARTDDYDICAKWAFHGFPQVDGDHDPPHSDETHKDITVFGQDCSYKLPTPTGLSDDTYFNGLANGDFVGFLECEKFTHASCFKRVREKSCGSLSREFSYQKFECFWD